MNDRGSTWPLALLTLVAMAVLLGVPFLLRPASARMENPLELVIVSPHDEAIKEEFKRAFSDWHQARFGRPVNVVWLNVGGTGDITRYVESKFSPQFRRVIGNTSPDKINWLWVDRPTATAPDPMTAKAGALANVGIDIDIFFGAGDYEHKRFKANGWIARYDLPTSQPNSSNLNDDFLRVAPKSLGGQPLYDPDHYWYGAVLTRVGIIANNVVCRKLGLAVPKVWADLAQPPFRDQLALADPMSGSAKLCYEMALEAHGWEAGWRMLTNIAANGRYFSSGSTQVALDVSRCEAAAGMIIDYYGRTQVGYVDTDPATGLDRLAYFSPTGETAATPDPISIFRGAKNREVAERFVQFVLSIEGQKLWMTPAGSPGGPKKFALYRPSIRPDVYGLLGGQRVVPDDPFTEPGGFNMDGRKQGRRFAFLGVLMRAAFIDNDRLLKRAADYARAAAPDSPARVEFDAVAFPEGDWAAKPPAPGSMWARADEFNRAAGDIEKEKIAAELTSLFRAKYERVLAAAAH